MTEHFEPEQEVQEEIARYHLLPVHFDGFIELPELADGPLALRLAEKYPGDEEKKHVPSYNFDVTLDGEKIGHANLRIGYKGGLMGDSLYYGGQVAYGIDEAHRGNGYAVRACRLLVPVAMLHGMTVLYITNAVANRASRRVCEKLGLRFVREAAIPPWHDLYERGHRFSNIYEWRLCP